MGAGGESQGQKLISNNQERITQGHVFFFFFFITYAAIKDISDKNLGVKFTGILSVLSQSFEKTPQTFNLGLGTPYWGKCFIGSTGTWTFLKWDGVFLTQGGK